MHKDPFVVLGVSKDATQAEVQAAYETLRDKYRADIHIEGDEGKRAAKMLSEVEDAYTEAMAILSGGTDVKDVYTHIADLLKRKDLDGAQSALDKVSERDAEWHYYQSAVYHSKGWAYEAKSQLEMAINMDPGNQKYKDTLDRMKKHEAGDFGNANTNNGNPNNNPNNNATYNQNQQQRSYNNYNQQQVRRSTAGDCCASLICADCCCECMGGDLIRCC